ncbi:phage gp6-like head-tail connector protein [Pontibacillus salipaludis]|uniref:Uncharacterized protein n=1 Tax=Pontibacillus salipaludis TaxID=1697394 RepID=A0ABQ1PWU9_9BACI|nr:phage gp6-like head-tail connector protein [Pontibacillus salipaludis]GGD05400.1 hypothetical protein GCM10011389_11130 [Pontibacillus salipaludis]
MDITTLLPEVKRYLKITWNEEDEELKDLLQGGKYYLEGKTGVQLDFSTNFKAKQLLKDYCRYVYNHTFELFEINFGHELTTLAIEEGVKQHVAESAETDTSSI